MLFNKIRISENNPTSQTAYSHEEYVRDEVKRIIQTRTSLFQDPDNPFSFGTYCADCSQGGDMEHYIINAIETFYPQFKVEEIDITKEPEHYFVDLLISSNNKLISVKHFF